MTIAAFGNQVAAQIRPVDLGTLGGHSSGASAVNAGGQVVGASLLLDGSTHAFSWTEASGMIDLGTLGGNLSSASAVNARGQVVGMSATADGATHAFSWTAAGGMIDLGTLGGTFSNAVAVNASGRVVGFSTIATADQNFHAFSWTAAGGMIDLGTLGGAFSFAVGVNASGQVVGNGFTAEGRSHAFSWTMASGMIDLGTLGGDVSFTNAVNARGQVVGVSATAGAATHGFSWTAAGGMIDLGTLGGIFTEAHAVNAGGQVVGVSTTAATQVRAFSWTGGAGMIDLGTVGGDGTSVATAVNASGQVIGYTFVTEDDDAPRHAFSWTAKGGMIRLDAFDGNYSNAVAMNARGQAIGASSLSNGQLHAALWQVTAKTLRPIADTFVRASLSSTNFGHALTLRVKKGPTRRPYLKFDISQITDSDRVTLRLHGNASDATGPVSATVYAVNDVSWNEHTLTWNTRPALGKVIGSVTVGGTAAQWVYVDVTKFVRSERRAGRNVISLALRSVVPSSAFAEFQSREAGDTGPRLVVTDGGSVNR